MMRRVVALLGVGLALYLGPPARATPAAWGSVYNGFAPVQHILTSSGTETVPTGALHVVIEAWGAGGAGIGCSLGCVAGGGSGSFGGKTLSLTSSDWTKTFTCTVGAAGVGVINEAAGTDGGNSSIVNGTDGQTLSIATNGGKHASGGAGAGGAAGTGGATNTAGNAGTGGGSGSTPGGPAVVSGSTGLSAGNGGSGVLGNGVAGNGGVGQCAFTYSWNLQDWRWV